MGIVGRDIISRLERDILPLEGLKLLATDNNIDLNFRPIENAFPNASFPIGCTHEFLHTTPEDSAATCGFIAALLSKLMQLQGTAVWISASRTLFPAALYSFGINPDKIIFIDIKKDKDVLYAVEESLKCKTLTTVIGEIKQINFKESRRLQLAAEQSRVTGFLIRNQTRNLNTIACVSRWKITSLSSELEDGLPGVGFPRWKVELLKVRNGKPATWQIEYSNCLQEIKKKKIFSIPIHERRKTG